jgi:diguanylate cyclase (GGDEF)-like protein
VERKEKITNLYLWSIVPPGILALTYSIYVFPLEKISAGLIAFSVLIVFFSSYLRIQLPRTKIYLTIFDTLIILSLLIYGGAVSVLLVALESGFASFNLRRKGSDIEIKTFCLNVSIAVLSVFFASLVSKFIFTEPEKIVETGNNTDFIGLLIMLTLSLFVINSVGVSASVAIKSSKTLWQAWNEYSLNALVMYMSGAIVAGISVKAMRQIDIFLFGGIVAFFTLAYIIYRRYVSDVKETTVKAMQGARERAEQAENHILELQQHIAEQDRVGQALRDSKERFRHAAFHDGLTDLPNRNQFMETLQYLLEKCKSKPDFNFAVLFLDLNRFKTVNDSLGHSIGDRLIKEVAKRLKVLIYDGDLVARFSGDEFAIIIKDVADVKELASFAELIKYKLSAPFSVNERQIFTSVSIGIAMSNTSYDEAEDILRDADIAMYSAKENNKDYVIFDKMMHIRAVTLMQVETDLRYAIERQELCVFYQPIIKLNSMQLVGFEALIRWNHPKRGLVPPGEFIPVCEDTGLIVPITLWILQEACEQVMKWQDLSPENESLMISINLSGKHFAQDDLVDQVSEILTKTKINPALVKLELTESAVMDNAERVILMLKDLKKLGVQLSIDDFGTGYSSLSYLHRFPIDTLKIDRSFVSEMETGSENGEIVRTIIALAKTLKMNVIAEGIESIHQLHQLQILSCEYGQGFLFSRPIPVPEVEKLFEDTSRWQNILPTHIFPAIAQDREFSSLRLAK